MQILLLKVVDGTMGDPDVDSFAESISICHDSIMILYMLLNKGDVYQYRLKIMNGKLGFGKEIVFGM